MEEGSTSVNISDLAGNAKGRGRKGVCGRLPRIPLVILAPLLVVAALLAVVLPNSYILSDASVTTAGYLSSKYLAAVISEVKFQVEGPINGMVPTVRAAGNLPNVVAAFSGAHKDLSLSSLRASAAVPDILALQTSAELFTLSCSKAQWKAGYSAGSPSLPSTFDYYNNTVFNYIDYGWINAIMTPAGVPGVTFVNLANASFPQQAWAFDSSTYQITNLIADYPLYGGVQSSGTQMLGGVEPLRNPSFAVQSYPSMHLTIGFIDIAFFDVATDALPSHVCKGGLIVDVQWNAILKNAKPVTDSVVAIFSLTNFGLLGSSNMESPPATGGSSVYTYAVPDAYTNSLQQNLQAYFGNDTARAVTDAQSGSGYFELDLGTYGLWVVTVGVAQPGAYSRGQMILVVALPRQEIYGVSDAAQAKGRSMSLGVSAAVVVGISAIFFLIAMTLQRLARQMVQLTKMDFSTLESSGMLDERSLIFELSAVQTVFATMVRAFAGAIQRNKTIIAGPSRLSAPINGQSGKTSTSSGEKRQTMS
ncbi:hypothetical protein HDU88_007946 [Geranomyces variabilis]|nr:hypothetical protein HDU88_007946 [Geranomyces variabilis]